MSIYAGFGKGPPTILASNTGWSQFGDWVDGLDVDEFSEVVHLWEHGWSQEGKTLSAQLSKAIESNQPDGDVKPIAENLVSLVAGEEVIVITDGFGPGKDAPTLDDLKKRVGQ